MVVEGSESRMQKNQR